MRIPAYRAPTLFACSVPWRISPSRPNASAGDGYRIFQTASNVYRSPYWDVVAKALEAAGNTSSETYIRAAALAQGKLDPMPTSHPEAPYSISAVAG